MARVLSAQALPVTIPDTGIGSRSVFTIVSAGVLIALDIMTVVFAFAIAWHVRFETALLPIKSITPWFSFAVMGWFTAVIMVGTLAVRRLYMVKPGGSTLEYSWGLVVGTTSAFLLSIALTTFILKFDYPRAATGIAWIVATVGIEAERHLVRSIAQRLHRRGIAPVRTLLIGTGDTAQTIIDRVNDQPRLGHRIAGILSDDAAMWGKSINGIPVVGSTDELEQFIAEQRIDEVLIALPGATHQRIVDLIVRIPTDGVDVKVAPDLLQLMADGVSIDDLSGIPLVTVKQGSLRGWNRIVKRALDVVFSTLVLIFMSPVLMLIALLVKITSRGPALYSQERIGYNGEHFQVLKFRSMRVDAEKHGPGWTRQNDDRRTPIGTFLRRFSLDELPQFINILFGDMSIVGPRPERPMYVEQFSQSIPRYMERHRERCGLTGWAQVNGLRGDTSIELRTRYDLYYVDNWSLMLDLRIIALTLLRLLRDDSAY